MPRDGRWREMEAAKFRIRDFVVKISTKSAPIRTTSKPFARFAAHEAAPESALEDFRKKFPEVLVGKPPRRPVSVRRKPPRRKTDEQNGDNYGKGAEGDDGEDRR
jgi:hypothetical protein